MQIEIESEVQDDSQILGLGTNTHGVTTLLRGYIESGISW